MTTRIQLCPIWNSDAASVKKYEASGYFDLQRNVWHVADSPRAAGGYVLPEVLLNSELIFMSAEQKARLTTWLVDQRSQGEKQPMITEEVIEYVKTKRPLPVPERSERLLRFITNQADTVADRVAVDASTHGAYAWSESTTWEEVDYYLGYLKNRGWLDDWGKLMDRFLGTVTVEGYSQIADLETNTDSSQAFVAMWFDRSMNEAFERGIKPAIEEAGYSALRIDQKPDVNKIDDEIIAEIRRSRFLVADFTHGEHGARGGGVFRSGVRSWFGDTCNFLLPQRHGG